MLFNISKGKDPFILFIILFLTGCSYFFNNGNQYFKISYKSQSSSCIARANKTISDYFNKTHLPSVSEDQIDQFRVCYQDSIESFIKHTDSGRLESKKYSAENITLFLKKFYPEIKVSFKNIEYYLALKHFLIGGGNDTLSKDELLVIKKSLLDFSNLLKAALPYRFIYFKKAGLNKNFKDYKIFNLAFQILNEKVNNLVQNFESYGGERNINLRSLIQFFLNQIDSDLTEPFVYTDMIISFKNLVIPSEGNLLKRKNLKVFINQSLLAYRGLMRFEYFVKEGYLFNNIGNIASYLTKALKQLKHSDIFKTIALRGISDILGTGYQILSYPIKLSPNDRLSYEKINNLLISLEKAELLGDRLTAKVLSLFMRRFSKKWMDPGFEETTDLTMAKITYIKDMYSIWIERQQVLNTLFSTPDRKTISFNDQNNELRGYKTLKSWLKILNKVSVHQWLDNDRMVLSKEMNDFTYRELTMSNSIFFLSEILMKPYNLSAQSLHEYKLKKEESQEIYEIMRILGIPLGFMDSRVADSGYRVFDESNNFSTIGNNDNYADLFEIYEYFSFALSSFQLSQQFYEDIDDDCLLDYIDVHDSPVIKPLCFRTYLRGHFDVFSKHLDTVSNFWRTASDLQKDKFIRTVEYIAQEGLSSNVPYKSGEIRTISVSLYYLESVFFVFDYNKDGFISGNELMDAYSHFKNSVKKFVFKKVSDTVANSEISTKVLTYFCDTEKEDIEKITQCLTPRVFIFLLNRGEFPTSDFYHRSIFLKKLVFNSEQYLFESTQVNIHDVLRFFSIMSKDRHERLIDQLKIFLLENKDILYSELSMNQSPDCAKQKNKTFKFCQWAKLIRCNETIKPDLYEWMKNNKYRLFPEKLWSESPDVGITEVLKLFDSSFSLHQKFSVHCRFPDYEEDFSFF